MSLFDKAIYVHVSAYYGIDYKTFSMPLHSHKRCEIMYIAQGQCRIDTADSSAIFRSALSEREEWPLQDFQLRICV